MYICWYPYGIGKYISKKDQNMTCITSQNSIKLPSDEQFLSIVKLDSSIQLLPIYILRKGYYFW